MSSLQERFYDKLKELGHYRRILTLMDWDMYTATPEQGYDDMADTYGFFSSKEFALSTDPELLEILQELMQPEEFGQLPDAMQYTVKYMFRESQRSSRIPAEFQREMTDVKNNTQRAWTDAKRSNDYALYAPHLDRIIHMLKEQISYTDPEKDVYEVLVNEFEEGMDTASIDRVFAELKEGLLPLIDTLSHRPHHESKIQKGTYPVEAQKEVQKLLLEYIGFDFASGLTSETEHPFTLGFSRNDVRVTNHFHEHDPLSAMFSAIHEGGHGIFEQNCDPSLKGTAADDCRYMGVHESQSRFFENILGRRKSFWVPIYAKVQELLPDLKDITLDEFMSEINDVRPSFIRCDADEVTYCIHIIIRYEMERLIFSQDIPVEDLPELWNKKTQEYLHITPPSDAEGILQDMHWSDGSFGYFPSYLLGSIYDGMFLEALEADLGDIDQLLEQGNIRLIQKWLSDKIHRYGSLRLPKDVLEHVCGKELSAKPLLNYFSKKYLD